MGVPDNTNTGTTCSGRTSPGSTNWQQYGSDVIYADVSASACGFTKTPLYLTSLGGDNNHYMTKGVTSIKSPTATGFRIYINQSGITPAIANQRKYHINWLAVMPNANVGAGVRKYYSAGGVRVAMREDGLLRFLLSDHLGSTSITTDSSGSKISELRYKPWGETRLSWGVTPTDYTYTGQYSNVDDFGLMYYGARWYDSYLNRWTQPDTIVPLATQGVQAWDRYAYANNNPVKYNDPSGHDVGCPECYGANNDDEEDDDGNGDSGDGGEEDNGLITVSEENGLCINALNIGCTGGSDYYEWWSDEYLPNLPGYIHNDLQQTANFLQDAAFVASSMGASAEIIGYAALGPSGAALGNGFHQVFTNPVETIFSIGSTVTTIADDVFFNGNFDNSVTSISATVAGTLNSIGVVDASIDTYASGYNHGVFPGITTIIQNIFNFYP
jgi:RHS repeat-associated protein